MFRLSSTVRTLDDYSIGVMSLQGYLDDGSTANLALAIDELYSKNVHDIVVDLGRVDYISSAGWGVFIARVSRMDENLGHFTANNNTPALT